MGGIVDIYTNELVLGDELYHGMLEEDGESIFDFASELNESPRKESKGKKRKTKKETR